VINGAIEFIQTYEFINMEELVIFIIVLGLSFHFRNNPSDGIGHYILYILIATTLTIIYRALRYSS